MSLRFAVGVEYDNLDIPGRVHVLIDARCTP